MARPAPYARVVEALAHGRTLRLSREEVAEMFAIRSQFQRLLLELVRMAVDGPVREIAADLAERLRLEP